jgi:hypothetical protein
VNRFVYQLCIFLAAYGFVLLLACMPSVFHPLDYNFGAYRMIDIKLECIENLHCENKIIIIGGSNVRFGINAGLIERLIMNSYCVYNYGLYAGMGLDLILGSSKKVLSKGDVVILSLEDDLFFQGSNRGGGQTIKAIIGNKTLIKHLRLKNIGFYFHSLIKVQLNQYKGHIYSIFGNLTDVPLVENIDNIGKSGDLIDRPNNLNAEIQPYLISQDQFQREIDESIIEYIDYCSDRGIQIIADLPPIYTGDYDAMDGIRNEIIKSIFNKYSIPVMPQKRIYHERSQFYNSCYHLSEDARDVRSLEIFSFLNPYIN